MARVGASDPRVHPDATFWPIVKEVPRRPSTHIDDPVAVGTRIREARLAAGLKQRELTFEGCTPAYLSRVEAGQRIPSLQILTKLAAELVKGTAPDADIEE